MPSLLDRSTEEILGYPKFKGTAVEEDNASKSILDRYQTSKEILDYLSGKPAKPVRTPIEPRGVLAETASALGSGFVSTAEALGATAEMIGIPGGKAVREKMQEVNESDLLRRPDYLAEGTVWEKPERLTDWRWWVRSLGENAPNMATMMVPGIAAVRGAAALGWGAKAIRAAGLAGAWSGSMSLEAGSAYSQAKGEMTKAGTYDADTVEKVATLEGLTAGVANSLIELLPFDNLFLKQAGADRFLKRIARQTFLEGSTESAQEAVNIYVEKLGHKPDQNFSDNIGRILESGIIGGALGGVAGGTIGTVEHRKNVRRYNALGEQLGLSQMTFNLKENGVDDKEIAKQVDTRIAEIRARMEEAPEAATLTGGTETKDVAKKPTLPDIDTKEMVNYLLYGEGKYTPPPGIFERATTRTKKGVLGVFGMKEKVPGPDTAGTSETTKKTTTDPSADALPSGPTAGKDIALAEPLAKGIDQEKKVENRKKGQSLFDNVIGELTQEDQQRLEAARQQELLLKEQEDQQAGADQEAQALAAITQAAAEKDVVVKDVAGDHPQKQALASEVMGLSDRVVLSAVQSELGINVQPAGQDRYEIVTAEGAQPLPILSLRKLLAEKHITDYDALQVAQVEAEKQHQVDLLAAQQRTEESRIKKEKEIAGQALANTREELRMRRTLSPQQHALLQAVRDQLTPQEIALLDAGPAVSQAAPPRSLQALGVRGRPTAIVPNQEISDAGATGQAPGRTGEQPSTRTAQVEAAADLSGEVGLPPAEDNAADEAKVRGYVLDELATQLKDSDPSGWVTNAEGKGKRIAAGGWISRTVKKFGTKSTTPLRDEKGNPVTLNLSKTSLANVIDKARTGKPLTDQQQAVHDVILSEAKDEEAYAWRMISEEADALANSDFNPDEFVDEEATAEAATHPLGETITKEGENQSAAAAKTAEPITPAPATAKTATGTKEETPPKEIFKPAVSSQAVTETRAIPQSLAIQGAKTAVKAPAEQYRILDKGEFSPSAITASKALIDKPQTVAEIAAQTGLAEKVAEQALTELAQRGVARWYLATNRYEKGSARIDYGREEVAKPTAKTSAKTGDVLSSDEFDALAGDVLADMEKPAEVAVKTEPKSAASRGVTAAIGAPTAKTTLPDLTVTGQDKPVPGHPEAGYVVHHRKPDLIPDTFKVVMSRMTPLFSVAGTGMDAITAYRDALRQYEAKLAQETQAKPTESKTAEKKVEGAAFQEGDRVVFAKNGRHGKIGNVSKIVMRSIMLYGGQSAGDTTSFHYTFVSDSGAEFYANAEELSREEGAPPAFIPDVKVEGKLIEPEHALRRIRYAKESARKHDAAAQRARKQENIQDHKRDAQRERDHAAEEQRIIDAWSAKYPAEAEAARIADVGPTPTRGVAVATGQQTAATPTVTGASAATGSKSLADLGLVVTKGTTNTGKTVWNISGNTKAHSETIKRAGGRWYGPKKVWSFYNGDPTAQLQEALGIKPEAVAPPATDKVETTLTAWKKFKKSDLLTDKDAAVALYKRLSPAEQTEYHKLRDALADEMEAKAEPGSNAPQTGGVTLSFDQRRALTERWLNQEDWPGKYAWEGLRDLLRDLGIESKTTQKLVEDARTQRDSGRDYAEAFQLAAERDLARWEKSTTPVPVEIAKKYGMVPAASLGKAASEVAKGVASSYDAIAEILKKAGKGPISMMGGGVFDEELYNAIKPHLQATYNHFRAAAIEVKEWMKETVSQFVARGFEAQAIIPYIKRFYMEVTQNDLTKGEGAATLNLQEGGIDHENGKVPRGESSSGALAGVGGTPGLDAGKPARTGEGALRSGETESVPGQESGARLEEGKRAPGEGQEPGGGPRSGEPRNSVAAGRSGVPRQPADVAAGETGGRNPQVGGKPSRRTADGGLGVNTRIEPSDVLFHSGKVARINANIRAIELSKQLVEENRNATPAEQKTLLQFSGWGAVAQDIFNPEFDNYLQKHEESPDNWRYRNPASYFSNTAEAEKYREWEEKYGRRLHPLLGGMLTEEEWKSAAASTMNAHYTSREVIDHGLWGVARRLGFEGGRVLEPAAGIGHILGLMPADFAGRVQLQGIELDRLSGQILSQLYPKADIQVTGFEKAQGIPDNSVDLVISNFPFGNYPINDNAHPAYSGWSIHNYFFARSVDALRPGGVLIAITSRYTMDSTKNGKTRELLADKADLVGAIRLPNNAFGKNAGTEVTTDIIILRKKTAEIYTDRNAWRTNAPVKINDATNASINEYFVQHPEMVLGKHSMEGTMYGGKEEYTLAADNSRPLAEQIDEAVARLPQGIYTTENAAEPTAIQRAEAGTKDGTFVLQDGKLSYVNQGILTPPEWSAERKKVLQTASFISVRDMAGALIRTMQKEDATAEDVADLQRKLNRDYDLYRSKHGPFHERGSAFLADDVEFPLLLALENEASKPVSYVIREGKNKGETRIRNQKLYTKADIFSKRTLFPFSEPTTAENIEDAVNVSLTYKNHVSPDYIATLLGKDKTAVQAELIEKELAFLDPANGLLESRSEYLSGNVREKLRIADQQGLEKNAEALRAVQPRDLTIDEIYFRLGSEWIPANVIDGFMTEKMESKATAALAKVKAGEDEVSRWTVDDAGRWNTNSPNYTVWGAEGRSGTQLVEDSLNLHRTEIYDYITGPDGKEKRVKNQAKSLNAQQKQREIQKAFKEYVLEHADHASAVAAVYNREKNNYVVRQYDVPGIDHYPHASHLINLRAHQKGAVSRGLQGSTVFAHAVGTGKTYMYSTLAMELRRTGQAHKPLIVVQGSTVNQFAGQAKKLYPAARILCPSKKDRTKSERRALLARIATNDYDMIIIPHSFFDDLNVNPEREKAFIEEQLEEIKAAILDLGGDVDKPKRSDTPTVKQLHAMLARKKARLEALKDSAHGIDTIYFDEMGIDAVLVDEAHHYKRGDFSTKMGNVKGLDRGAAAKSFRFLMKTRAIQEKTRGKNIYLATGTPVSNTTAELWTLLRYVRPDLLAEFGAGHFDGFASMFGDTTRTLEQTETGEFKDIERFNKYVNGPELIKMWQTVADVILQEDVPGWADMIPKMKGEGIQSVAIPRSQELADEIEQIRQERAEWDDLSGMEKKELSYIPLLLFNRAKQAAIDLRLVRADAADNPDSKTNRVVQEVFNRWEESREVLGTQLVFADTYRGPNGFSLYDDIKKKLVGMGIPEAEIANITENKYNTDAAKETLFDKINQGLVRVVIGSTAKLGIGVNVQERLVALHHVDAPMRPMDFEQRNGRILRPGNTNHEVEVLAYAVINTLDSVTYDRLQKKQKFINQLLRGKLEGRSFEDPADELQFTFEDLMAASAGNPLVKKRFELENQIREIAVLEDGYRRKIGQLRSQISQVDGQLTRSKENIAEANKEKQEAEKTFPDNQYQYHIAGTTYADPKDGKKALQAEIGKAEERVEKAYIQVVADLQKREEKPPNEDRLARSLRKDKEWTIPDGWTKQINDIKERIAAQINGKELVITIKAAPTLYGDQVKQAQQIKDHRFVYGYQLDPRPGTRTDSFGKEQTTTDTLAAQNSLHGGLEGILTSIRHILKGIGERPAELTASIEKQEKNLSSMKAEIKKPFEFTDTLSGLKDQYSKVLDELGATKATPVGDEAETGEETRPDITLDMPRRLDEVVEETDRGTEPQYALGEKESLGQEEVISLVRGLARTVKGLAVVEHGGETFIRTKGGEEVRIWGVNRIDADTVSLSLGYSEKARPGRETVGEFRRATAGHPAEIRLVRGQAGAWTINHEFYHFLEDIGAISNEDKNLLNRKVRALVAKDSTTYAKLKGMSPAEQRAEWTGNTLAGKYDATTPTGKIIQKVKDVIDQILNALGIRTAGGVVRDIRSGRIQDRGVIPGTRRTAGAQYALADRAEQATAAVTGAAVRAGNRGLAMMGARNSPATREAMGAFAKHWKEFWQPFSTVPDGDKILAKRYEAMGNVGRAVRFIDELFQKVNAYSNQVKKDLFWYLNGDIPIETLPEDVRETAQMIQRRTEVIGEMLVDRGIIAEGQFEKYRGKYIHYMYAKHVMGEDKPIFLTSTGKLNLSYTKSRNTKLTLQQKKELGLIEDASVAVPVGMGKALTDIAKWDYLKTISDNADWVWQPSLIKVPIGRPLSEPIRGRTRRNVTMGIGKLIEEAKTYDAMMAKHPTPEIAEIHRILHEALDAAEAASENMPADFVQLPNSKGYGPLAGAYIRKPIADDIMPVLDVATDRGKLMNTILEIERQGMAGFKMGKVALNFPTAVRNIVSNIIQNNMRGRALSKIPGDIILACESLKAKDAHYEEAFGMGLFHTNWFVSEINDVLDEFRKVKGGRIDQLLIAVKNVAKYYGKIDDINKLAIFIEQRNAGKTIDEAALEAMKWGMDYSLTSRSIKGLRQTIMPFATYQYKIAPLILESLKKRPWVLAKFGLIYTVAKAAAMGFNDLDDDDWEDLEKQLPAYIKKSGSMMILPWKSNKGQWQWVNLEYFFPWGNYLAIARDMKAADLGEGLRDAGLSNPFLSMLYTGLSAREDQPPLHSYFGTPIYNQLDTAPVKAAKLLEYMANIWMPSMATRQGAIGYTGRAIAGGEDRWGREVSAGQALGRWFGLNIVSVSPEQTRAQASVRIQDLRKEQSRIEANPSYDEEEKKAYAGRLNEKLAEIAQEAPAAVLPITKAKGKDPVYEALQAMAAKGILHTAPPSRSVEIAGTPFKMTMDQYGRYLEQTSEIARNRLLPLVNSPTWEAMSDKRKSDAVSGIVANARKGIRQRIKVEIARENQEKIRTAKMAGR